MLLFFTWALRTLLAPLQEFRQAEHPQYRETGHDVNASISRLFLKQCFTLRTSRLDSSSWRVRVQVFDEKLVDQTTELIL